MELCSPAPRRKVACPGFPFALCVAAVCFVSFSSVAPVVILCFVFLFVVWGCRSFLSQGSVLVLLFCLASWPLGFPWLQLTLVGCGQWFWMFSRSRFCLDPWGRSWCIIFSQFIPVLFTINRFRDPWVGGWLTSQRSGHLWLYHGTGEGFMTPVGLHRL